MSKRLRRKIKGLEAQFEKLKEEEVAVFWQNIYAMTDELHELIYQTYGIEPKMYYYNDEYVSDIPTTYRSALYKVAKAILELTEEDDDNENN